MLRTPVAWQFESGLNRLIYLNTYCSWWERIRKYDLGRGVSPG